MAGFLPSASKAYLLSQIGAKALYVGLAVAVDDSVGQNLILANLTEVTTPGYTRAPVVWSPPLTDATGNVSLSSSADVNFPVVTADINPPAPYAFVTDAASGTTGRLYYLWQLAEPVATLAGKPTKAPAGGLIIE